MRLARGGDLFERKRSRVPPSPGEKAQGDRLAGAGSPGDEGEAAFATQLLDAPAERFDAPRDMERLHGHVGRKRIPLEAIEREQLLVHVSSPCSSLGR